MASSPLGCTPGLRLESLVPEAAKVANPGQLIYRDLKGSIRILSLTE
jgi:hypothetical protein